MQVYSLKEAWGENHLFKYKYAKDFFIESDEEYLYLRSLLLEKEPFHKLIWEKVANSAKDIDYKTATLFLAFLLTFIYIILKSIFIRK